MILEKSMLLLDYIIIFFIIISFFFGLSRGLYQEIVSSYFWFFNFYFFNKYDYFSSFFINAVQNVFLKNKILILVMIIFFFIIKHVLNFFMRKLIRKIKISYYNIILGGLFGIFRSILLVFFFLFIFSYFDQNRYNYYINHSFLILFFLKYKHYFLLLDII